MQDSRLRILEYLQAHGEADVASLADAVDLAAVTVRHHLSVLRQRDLVQVEAERSGRGRPRHIYRLSRRGAGRLQPEACERLTSRIIDLVAAQDDGEAERLFTDLAERALEDHRQSLADAGDEESRLNLVVDLLAEEGLQTRWERDGADFLLRDLECPYASLSREHQEVCCMDLRIIEAAVEGQVVRERWRPAGDDRCVFRIAPAAGQGRGPA